jgi:predicted ATPase
MTLPHSPERDEQELGLQIALGVALAGAHGTCSQEMKAAYTRARALCEELGDLSQLCQVLGELALYHYVRGEHRQAREFGERALAVAGRAGDPLLVALSHWYLGIALFSLGEYVPARHHFGEVNAFYEPQQHHASLISLRGSDFGVSALAYTACTLWCLGYPEQALKCSQEVLDLARTLGHPFSLVDVLCYAGCMLSEWRRDAVALGQYAQEMMQLASERVAAWLPSAILYSGAVLAMRGQVEEGIAQMRQALAVSLPKGERCFLSEAFCALAGAQAEAGRAEAGLATIDEALAFVDQADQRSMEAEVHRLRARLLLMQGAEAEAEAALHKSIEVSRRQGTRSWELRATIGLARLWQAQGRVDEARRALAEIYDWFTEGFETRDLTEARELLRELDNH